MNKHNRLKRALRVRSTVDAAALMIGQARALGAAFVLQPGRPLKWGLCLNVDAPRAFTPQEAARWRCLTARLTRSAALRRHVSRLLRRGL